MPTNRVRRRRVFEPTITPTQWALLCDEPIPQDGPMDDAIDRWCFDADEPAKANAWGGGARRSSGPSMVSRSSNNGLRSIRGRVPRLGGGARHRAPRPEIIRRPSASGPMWLNRVAVLAASARQNSRCSLMYRCSGVACRSIGSVAGKSSITATGGPRSACRRLIVLFSASRSIATTRRCSKARPPTSIGTVYCVPASVGG